MDTASVVLSFEPDPKEVAEAMTRHLTPMAKTARRLLLFGVVMVALGVFSLVVAESRPNDMLAGGAIIVGLLVIRANATWGRRWMFRSGIRRMPQLTSNREITASVEGLRMLTPTADLRFFWSHYERVVCDDLGVTLVLLEGNTAHFVPRRAFPDAVTASAWGRQVSGWVTEASAPESTDLDK